LPYPDPGRLVSLWEESSRQPPATFNSSGRAVGGAGGPRRTTVSVANLQDYQRRATTFFPVSPPTP